MLPSPTALDLRTEDKKEREREKTVKLEKKEGRRRNGRKRGKGWGGIINFRSAINLNVTAFLLVKYAGTEQIDGVVSGRQEE